MKILLITVSIVLVLALAWLLVMPSFTKAMSSSQIVDMPAQVSASDSSSADVVIAIKGPDQFWIDGQVVDFEGLKKAVHARNPSQGQSVHIQGCYRGGMDTFVRVADFFRVLGVSTLKAEQEDGTPNQPLQGTPAKAPSSSTEPDGRRS